MSNKFWIKLSKGDILASMELMALYPDNVKANRLIKELNYCMKYIEETEREHKLIYGKRGKESNNPYKKNSFINGLTHALNLIKNDIDYDVIKEEINRFSK